MFSVNLSTVYLSTAIYCRVFSVYLSIAIYCEEFSVYLSSDIYFRVYSAYLSTAMTASVFTDAQTDTPCRYGVTLHRIGPKGQPCKKKCLNMDLTDSNFLKLFFLLRKTKCLIRFVCLAFVVFYIYVNSSSKKNEKSTSWKRKLQVILSGSTTKFHTKSCYKKPIKFWKLCRIIMQVFMLYKTFSKTTY